MTSPASLTTLPPLGDSERLHSGRVAEHIRERVRQQGGVLGFGEFMNLALYAPGLGYYSAGATKLGAAGDFVTAPEISSLFSRCLARQTAQVLLAMGGGDVLELGAGSGRMAFDVLSELAVLEALPSRYRILEVSADRAERQLARLAGLPAAISQRVEWLDSWPAAPIRGVVLANEVLDALPVERFLWRGGRAHALGVGLDAAGGFEWRIHEDAAVAAAGAALQAQCGQEWPEGYASEVCLALGPWVTSLAEKLDEGVMLLIDYGLPRAQLYHPERARGSLRCHFRHRAHDDPFVHVGLQDITAWVDFTRVAEVADAAGLDVLGFNTQASFLIGAGIEGYLTTGMAESGVAEQARLAGEARRLMLPGEMGEIFKVIGLGRGCDAELAGFALQDLRGSL
jgi:SAM-dependent MidA family methyltransferase